MNILLIYIMLYITQQEQSLYNNMYLYIHDIYNPSDFLSQILKIVCLITIIKFEKEIDVNMKTLKYLLSHEYQTISNIDNLFLRYELEVLSHINFDVLQFT